MNKSDNPSTSDRNASVGLPNEFCVVCGNHEPGSPASGEGDKKAWLCAECVKDRQAYLIGTHGTALDSIAWAARRARAHAAEDAAFLCDAIAEGYAEKFPKDACRVCYHSAEACAETIREQLGRTDARAKEAPK